MFFTVDHVSLSAYTLIFINKITILRYIGFILNDMGQYEDALKHQKKSLKYTIELYGNDNINTAIAYGNIGLDYTDLGKYDKTKYDLAIKNHEKGKEIFLKECGIYSPAIALCYFNIGTVYYWKEDYEKALDFYKKSYEINIKCFGENHSKIAKLNSNIGMVYEEQNKLVEALANYNKALKIFKKNHGEYFHSVSNTYNNIGTIEKQKGNLQYYNFIEVFGVQESNSEVKIIEAKRLRNKFRKSGLISTITPHAPYSVPRKLMKDLYICRTFQLLIRELLPIKRP